MIQNSIYFSKLIKIFLILVEKANEKFPHEIFDFRKIFLEHFRDLIESGSIIKIDLNEMKKFMNDPEHCKIFLNLSKKH